MSELRVPLQTLVRQFLVGRTEGLRAPQVAAFLSGWTSAIEVLRHVDQVLPAAPLEVRRAVNELLDALEAAQHVVLHDDEPDEPPEGDEP